MKHTAIKTNDSHLPLPTEMDLTILNKIYALEALDLDDKQKELVRFLKSQLEKDWRKPLLVFCEELFEKWEKK